MEKEPLPNDTTEATTNTPPEPVAAPAMTHSENPPVSEIDVTPPVPAPAPDEAESISAKIQQAETGGPGEQKEDVLIGGIYQVIAKLEVVQHQLRRLDEEFDAKLKYDAHKEKIIDHLHEELQEYKNDIFNKHRLSMISDMIKIVDDIRKLTTHYRSIQPEKWDPLKLLDTLEQIPFDLEDMFLLQDVTTFTQASPTVDPTRQRITKKVATSDPLQDKIIAASLRPGYECDGRVIRPELVAVYIYKPPGEEVEARYLNE